VEKLGGLNSGYGMWVGIIRTVCGGGVLSITNYAFTKE